MNFVGKLLSADRKRKGSLAEQQSLRVLTVRETGLDMMSVGGSD
jgi:hypothetical protein